MITIPLFSGRKSSANLNRLVAAVVKDLMPETVVRNSFIINDVPADILFATREDMLCETLKNLLQHVVGSTEKSCIHIFARRNGSAVKLRVYISGSTKFPGVTNQVQELVIAAEDMNTCNMQTGRTKYFSIAPYTAMAA
jgi:hypothetical protein